MQIIDTHCHIHDTEFYPDNREEVYQESREAGVVMLCVGTDVRSSQEAIDFCNTHEGTYPVIGIHPHEAKDNDPEAIRTLVGMHRDSVIGIGEIGLDYYYDHSPRDVQRQALRAQLEIALDNNLPVSFHVRDTSVQEAAGSVWTDFWSIIDEFPDVRGVLHSFTDRQAVLDEALRRGFLIGINGISTFTKDEAQQQIYRELPLKHIILETDAPFLTPKPFRGTMNKPAYVGEVAASQAMLKGVPLDDVLLTTTANARSLYRI